MEHGEGLRAVGPVRREPGIRLHLGQRPLEHLSFCSDELQILPFMFLRASWRSGLRLEKARLDD
jgi:hypothetical protein